MGKNASNVELMQKALLFTSLFTGILLVFLCYSGASNRYATVVDEVDSTSNPMQSVAQFISTAEKNVQIVKWAKELQCFGDRNNIGPELDFDEVKIGEGVFFLLTSCPGDKKKGEKDVSLTARQACAVESAAVFHEEQDVYLLSLPTINIANLSESKNEALQALLTYPNIKIKHIDFIKFLTGTPLENLIHKLQKSTYPVVHSSDVLRFATLYRFQGLYLDLDVILIREMPQESCYAGAESQETVSTGVMKFGKERCGREMADACANEVSNTYIGNLWSYNSPGAITRVVARRCHLKKVRDMWNKTCDGYKTHPPPSFYPISYPSHKLFFSKDKKEEVERLIKNSYLVHYWNKFTYNIKADEPGVPFHDLAEKFCPRVFKAVNGKM